MVENTTQWVCNKCGSLIRCAQEGFLTWVAYDGENGEQKRGDIHIVHHYTASPLRNVHRLGCYFEISKAHELSNGRQQDDYLASFLGPDGLMQLLALLYDGRLPVNEVLEIIKRLHIPGYEEARPYFIRALEEELIEPFLSNGFYRQSEIDTVLRNRDRLG